MATITPAYSWPVPTSVDLVKDGASAIEALGDAIDASMNTALGTKKAGMVLLNTTSFSGVTSSSFPANTLSSAYTNYRLIVNLTSVTADNDSFVRLRASGTDNTASVYGGAIWYINSAGSSGSASSGATGSYWPTQYMGSTHTAGEYVMDILNPFETRQTGATGHQIRHNSTTTGDVEARFASFVHGANTSFDSITYGRASGNMTGVMSIYGYNK